MNHVPYSQRNRQLDLLIFEYDTIQQKLRNQIYIVVKETMGYDRNDYDTAVEILYKKIWKPYELHHGKLNEFHYSNPYAYMVLETIKNEKDIDMFLDIVEYTFKIIKKIGELSDPFMEARNATITPNDAIVELNTRFRQNSVGYQFIDNNIVKLSNELQYIEIVEPTVNLINNQLFNNANEDT